MTRTGVDAGVDLTRSEALTRRCAEIRTSPERIRVLFPAAAREIGRTAGPPDTDPGADRIEDEARARLLEVLADVLAARPDDLVREVADLYRYGDADERRAVLRALPLLGLGSAEPLLALVRDGLRTNDPRLIAAAMGGYAAEHLEIEAWRHGVLKCLFTSVPLRLVARLRDRADDELRRMVRDYAREREAAGRDVPADATDLLRPATTPTSSRER